MSVTIIQLLTIWLVFEAIHRVINPSPINATIMLTISILGLIFNLSMMKILDNPPGSESHDEVKEKPNKK